MNLHNTNQLQCKDRYFLSKVGILICMTFLILPLANWAQTDPLPARYKSVEMSLNANTSQSKSTEEIITRTIIEPGATWLRLFFEDVDLGRYSTLTITSELDGASQTFTASTIKNWQNTSAYFNGEKVTLKLVVASGENSIRLNIKELGIGIKTPVLKSQCGSNDDRVDATDDAIGRIVPIGCTGWIITNGKLVTAGHCVGSRAQIIEFNVPKSNPDRTIVHPGPEDQYPIGNFVSPYPNSPSQANDWAVFEAGANTQTGLTPIQAQGKSFNVVQSEPGSTITITGFGTDTGVDNQTQQTHTGPLSSVNNTFVRYRTDTTGGNSGSPIIDAATGNAVGVHAYGGCSGSGGSNFGERATIPAFWEAMELGGGSGPEPEECIGEVSSFPYNESFEGSLGAWKQSAIDDINWTINSGGTPSSGTGPNSASDGSSYVYVEASGNRSGYPNKKAILNSPCLNFSSLTAPSLTFQYHMLGSAINSLNVEVRTNNDGNWTSVFNKTGEQGDTWNVADVNLSSYANESNVQLRFSVVTGSGSSGWQSDVAIDAVRIQNGTSDPDPTCNAINFNDYALNSFSNQDTAGNNSSIGNQGKSITLSNNTWKYIALNYNVTTNTVIEFDFSSSSEGEIHGIGFEEDNSLTATRYFKVHGTQDYGLTNYDNYAGGTVTYIIPVGTIYTGAMDRLLFINDNDAGSGNNSTFSNVKIYEGTCGEQTILAERSMEREAILPRVGTENELDVFDLKIAPNPAKDSFSIHLNTALKNDVNASVYTILGRKTAQVMLSSGVNTIVPNDIGLNAGIYLVRIEHKGTVLSTQKLIIN
ncbi:trypsin-like peptidase domain-containing protein [Aquimarina sp. U1-2]|uniref:trypsin-like peptidase domain-containing protein n=1 Tax=Aquimarina sp. U1-2 TaxID=2823141 RepID=UPI001AECB4DF|nr:trypsin-like peptidase domain-containing protein [Aquimarina sp. U1-2]MBP2833824.1 trypsin-like peptidase domain-containing protein [Aquimarina sp. U1-2]